LSFTTKDISEKRVDPPNSTVSPSTEIISSVFEAAKISFLDEEFRLITERDLADQLLAKWKKKFSKKIIVTKTFFLVVC